MSAVITHTRVTAVGMIVPVVVIRDVESFGRAFGKAEQIGLAVIPEMVVAERHVGGLLAIQGAIALDLILVATGMTVEEIAIMHPDILVVLLKADVVAFVAIHIHDTDIANFDILGVFNTNTPAVCRCIVTDTFERDSHSLFFTHIDYDIAMICIGRVRHIAN